MQLKLKKLQGIVKETMKREKSAHQLMKEAVQVFGPSVDVSSDPRRVFAVINDKLTVMEARGQDLPIGSLKVSALLAAAETSKEARKLAAKLLPEKYAAKFLIDKDSSVRCAAAKRFTCAQLAESLRRFPFDDQLLTIVQQKRLFEAGIPTPKADDQFDMYGDGPLADVLDGYEPEDLTDGWYKRMAIKIFNDYKGRLDGNWKHLAISNLCSSIYATAGVKVDALKLKEMLEEVCENNGFLKEGFIFEELKERIIFEADEAETHVMPVLDEHFFTDPIKDLLRESPSRINYIDTANKLFNITYDVIEESLYTGDIQLVEAPQYGRLPSGYNWNSTAEKALDRYVSNWNERADARDSNCRIAWNYGFNTKINFSVVDK